MKGRLLLGGIIAVAGFAGQPSHAQEAPVPLKPFRLDDDKPVMRAQPVPKPAVIPEVPTAPAVPAVPSSTPIPRASPVLPAPPAITPRPPRDKPVKATPAPKATPMPQPDLPDPTEEIRITPQGTTMTPDQVQLSLADGYYAKKMWDMAAPEYEKFLGLYPNAADRPVVLFRLGNAYRQMGAVNAAKNSYETLLSQYPTNDLVGAAAYHVGDIFYAEKNYESALTNYRRASVRLKDPKLVHAARFFTARALENLGKKTEAKLAYEELVRSPQENQFLGPSRLSYALLLKDSGQATEALRQIQALAKETDSPELKAQATVYTGLWEIEADRPKQAQENLTKALEMPGIGRWKDTAQFGLLQLLFNEKKYQEVIDAYRKGAKDFTPEVRPQLTNLAAMAYRQLGKSAEATELFDEVIQDSPNTPHANEAMYERLILLYNSNAPKLVAEIDKYLVSNPETPKRDQVLLMKAEVLFQKQDYGAAVPIYEMLEKSITLIGARKGEALFRRGWCHMQLREWDRAIKAFTGLIEGYPTLKTVPAALCQRGLAKLRTNDRAGAVKDFEELIRKHPKAKERELALQQKALIHGQQNDNEAMAATFKMLIAEFPNTPAAAEASYWVGWSAFEQKDYKEAIEPLRKALELNKEEYFERASLRLMLAYFNLEDKEGLAREVESYTSGGGKAQVPYDVVRWLGRAYFETAQAAAKDKAPLDSYIEDLKKAATYLGLLTARSDARPVDFYELGLTYNSLRIYDKAAGPLEKYLTSTKDPAPRAEGLLALAQTRIGLGELDAAQKLVEEASTLQAAGPLNAESHIVAGDIHTARGNYEEAAKAYHSVSLIIDDENITPRALEKGVDAYRKAGKEADANRLLNQLQSRYPEYLQAKVP